MNSASDFASSASRIARRAASRADTGSCACRALASSRWAEMSRERASAPAPEWATDASACAIALRAAARVPGQRGARAAQPLLRGAGIAEGEVEPIAQACDAVDRARRPAGGIRLECCQLGVDRAQLARRVARTRPAGNASRVRIAWRSAVRADSNSPGTACAACVTRRWVSSRMRASFSAPRSERSAAARSVSALRVGIGGLRGGRRQVAACLLGLADRRGCRTGGLAPLVLGEARRQFGDERRRVAHRGLERIQPRLRGRDLVGGRDVGAHPFRVLGARARDQRERVAGLAGDPAGGLADVVG